VECGWGHQCPGRYHLEILRGPEATPGANASAHYPLEGDPELVGEQGIDHRIDGRVAVAQPEEHREDRGLDAVLAEGPYQIHGEEGQPADDEAAHDDGQCLGRLGFHAEPLHLELGAPLSGTLFG